MGEAEVNLAHRIQAGEMLQAFSSALTS
jgi:hypothetical protein